MENEINYIRLPENQNVGKPKDVVMPNIEDIFLIDKHYILTGRNLNTKINHDDRKQN